MFTLPVVGVFGQVNVEREIKDDSQRGRHRVRKRVDRFGSVFADSLQRFDEPRNLRIYFGDPLWFELLLRGELHQPATT